MAKLIIISAIILAFCMIFLSVGILFKKNGRFPNIHVGNNKEMRKRGIGCVQSQDRQARNRKRERIKEF